MKLKQQPDDFVVEELTDGVPPDGGPFTFYRLEKTGWTTPDAIAAIRRRWKVHHDRISYGGLKDRHARTVQHLTIHGGPDRGLEQPGIKLVHLGALSEPFTSRQVLGNRFTITLRSLSPNEIDSLQQAVPEITAVGVPNYFDDQRFGSVPRNNEFIAKEMILGRFESALRLALAAPYEHDRATAKKEKAILNGRWGDWAICKAELPKGHARSIVDYLVHHPTDFKGACVRLRPELQGLYLSAYQSHIWNRLLDAWIRRELPSEAIADVSLKTAVVAFPRRIPENPAWSEMTLPLPSARLKLPPDDPLFPLLQGVLAEEGLTLESMRIRGVDRPYFAKGDRSARVAVRHITVETAVDELARGRSKAVLRFDLPGGSYATMVVKRLTRAGQ